MANAPEYLLNLFLNYDKRRLAPSSGVLHPPGHQSGCWGDRRKRSPHSTSLPCPTTRSMSRSPSVCRYLTLSLGARNLLNPLIKEVYRSEYIDQQNIIANAYSKGIDFSLSLSTKIEF